LTLGERESGTARLEEAVTAYRDALAERTRARVPLDWVTTQNNLGNALVSRCDQRCWKAGFHTVCKNFAHWKDASYN
jgi:hypothetical protein